MNPSLRRDSLPVWVAVLLVLFLVLRIYDVTTLPSGNAAKNSPDVSDAAMQDLIETDLTAKTAYVKSLTDSGPVVHLDTQSLRTALRSAERFQTETANSPSAARRVIVLRALLRSADPPAVAKKDLLPLAAGKNKLSPLAAFTTALPAGTPAQDRAAEAAEGAFWKTAFDGTPLTPDQLTTLADQIRHLPNIRWWVWPALSALYQQQGDLSEADRYALEARSQALSPLASTAFLLLLRVVIGLAGVLILIYLGVKAYANTQRKPYAPPFPDLWPTLPERLPLSERKLGAGDLMAVFVVYLLSREVIDLALEGLPGIGPHHLLRVPGLLSPFLGAIKQMPALQRGTLEIVLSAVTYLLSAVPPLIYLWAMARRRHASLALEIGWTGRAMFPNIAYGIAGYALATPLMLLVALLAPQLFRHAPAPSNPVIPEMIFASGFWTTLLLILLASVAAPLVEELLFRGVFFQSVRQLMGPWAAIVTTGLVFGFVHPVGLVEMLAIAVLGGVFAWMAETRKSLVPSMTAHCLNNLTSTLILLFALAR